VRGIASALKLTGNPTFLLVQDAWRWFNFRSGLTMSSRTIFAKQHRLAYVVVSLIIGCTCAIIFNMRGRGIVSAQVAGVPLALALFWLMGVFLLDLVWRIRTCSSGVKFVRAAAWSGICLCIIVITWILLARVVPDSARVYLMLRRSYIETHWQVDPVTKLTYFPLDFYRADESEKTFVPGDFFVLDQDNQLKVDPATHEVTWPKCLGAIYTANRLDDTIYILRHYTMSVTAPIFPCLITPAPKSERLPTNSGTPPAVPASTSSPAGKPA
jgi:hypothetical protein